MRALKVKVLFFTIAMFLFFITSCAPTYKPPVYNWEPIDYFDTKFAESQENIILKKKLLTSMDMIIRLGELNDAPLQLLYDRTGRVKLIDFKGNNYLHLEFNSDVLYNTLQLTEYEVGAKLFDKIVKKVLLKLDEVVGDPELFYGYDIVVIGHTASFLDKSNTRRSITYHFYTPQTIVKKYVNKDISGQKLLDSSIILMDDSRVELRLH